MNKELLILYGARYAALEMMGISNNHFVKALEDGTYQVIEFADICNYLTEKIEEYEKQNYHLNNKTEYARDFNVSLKEAEEALKIEEPKADIMADVMNGLKTRIALYERRENTALEKGWGFEAAKNTYCKAEFESFLKFYQEKGYK